MYQKFAQIAASSRRIPFSSAELKFALDTIKVRKSKGADLLLGHPRFCTDAEDARALAEEGAVFLHSPDQLDAGFLFVKLDAGRSLFGAQKAVFASYVCLSVFDDEWETGTTFRMWGLAITSIGNIYRAEGFR